MDIKITVSGKRAVADDVLVVCGNSDYVLSFAFDEEWDAYKTKTMRLDLLNGTYIDTVFNGTSCALPVIQNRRRVAVGAYAGDLHTTTPAILRCVRSITDLGGSPAAPSEDVYAQVMELLNERQRLWYPSVNENGVLSWTKSLSDEVPASVSVKGEKGDTGATPKVQVGPVTTGEPGTEAAVLSFTTGNNVILTFTIPRGADGAAGYTPVRGTDYWTAADQTAIVNAVLEALPAAEDVSV